MSQLFDLRERVLSMSETDCRNELVQLIEIVDRLKMMVCDHDRQIEKLESQIGADK